MAWNIISAPFRRPVTTTALLGAGDQLAFDGAGLNAVFSKIGNNIANGLGVDVNLIKAAAPAAIGGLLGSVVGQGTLGMALGMGLTALQTINAENSPIRELVAGITPPTTP